MRCIYVDDRIWVNTAALADIGFDIELCSKFFFNFDVVYGPNPMNISLFRVFKSVATL